MKTLEIHLPRKRAFTLIELLVVIAIIGILASMSAVAVISGLRAQKRRSAATDAAMIVHAIERYYSTYSKYPVSANAESSVFPPALPGPIPEDFTYGGTYMDQNGNPLTVQAAGTYQSQNSEVVAILMDMEMFPNGTPTINVQHVKNVQRINFLDAKIRGDVTSPGIGADGVYRDPWGMPYIISLDVNADDKCRDAVHKRQAVSQKQPNSQAGIDGLLNTIDPGGNGDHFECGQHIMVWSAGPDRRISLSDPANSGVNRDNIRSWR
jgi:prepilin-type N-terminal cleavage/methylation domain-containing protein